MKSRKLVTCAMLIALHTVLSLFVSVNLGNMKITFDALPIIIGAMLYGPVGGMVIGLLGAFFAQLLSYGLSVTTVLWILPAAFRGFFVGSFAKLLGEKFKGKVMLFVIVASSLLVTALNTGVMAADAIIYGYYSHAYVFGALIFRIISGVITAVLYTVVVPELLKYLRQAGIRSEL